MKLYSFIYIVSIVIFIPLWSCSDEEDNFPSNFEITITNIGIDFAAVSWSESIDPFNGLITYDIYLDGNFITSKTNNLNYTFDNLHKATNYDLQIIASNNRGFKTESSLLFLTNPNLAPSDFEVLEAGNSIENPINVIIRWSEAIDPEGEVVLYKLYLNEELQGSTNNTEWLFNQLPEMTYNGQILASDSDGNETSISFSFENSHPAILGDVTITTQQEVNDFGENNYNIILGRLDIHESIPGNITNLSPLKSLIQVTKGLRIWDNLALTSLTGLENLTNDFFKIDENLYANLYLVNNPLLENIEALGHLKNITSLQIINNGLVVLNGLDSIKNFYNIEIIDNNFLIDISDLFTNNNKEIVGLVTIKNNTSLQKIDGLNNSKIFGNYTYIGGNRKAAIEISDNESLISIEGFSGDQMEIFGWININNNAQLISINGFSGIQHYGEVTIENNPNLNSVIGFYGDISYGLTLANNDALEEIDAAFSGLITGNLKIINNGSLKTINGLTNYKSGVSIIKIDNNPMLSSLEGLQNLDNNSFLYDLGIGIFYITNNNSLTSLKGLSQCKIYSTLFIDNNSSLVDFCDIDSSAQFYHFSAYENAYDPTLADLINGNCKL